MNEFETSLSRQVWEQRYRFCRDGRIIDRGIGDSWRRVAHAVASVEASARPAWEARFCGLLQDFRFLPGGRILAAAGTNRQATLLNCFVMGIIEDSMDGIFAALKESALTMQQGGGIGCDFSTLRPRGARGRATGNVASGPVSFMRVWDAACGTITGSGPRGGAMMATMRCDHPDIIEFVEAKKRSADLRRFNLSVQVTDEFMTAVAADQEWPLMFPREALSDQGRNLATVQRIWPGGRRVDCAVLDTLSARKLWQCIVDASMGCGDPGMLFVDTINRENTLHYCEQLTTCNPCGELPLPPYGACDLGSLNLPRFIREPFTPKASVDLESLAGVARGAVRFLDNVLDLTPYPLPQQRQRALQARRIGLGVTGLADALIMLGLHYDSDRARDQAAAIAKHLRNAAYAESVELAREKGCFPLFQKDSFLAGAFVGRLPGPLREGIARHGLRNGQLLAIAPAGSISLLANNVSSGIEPVFAFEGARRVRSTQGWEQHATIDQAWRHWREQFGAAADPSDAFVTARDLPPAAHLAMQAALQIFVDGAISKTINLPEDYPVESGGKIFETAHRLRLKGCTVFSPNAQTGSVLSGGDREARAAEARLCCVSS